MAVAFRACNIYAGDSGTSHTLTLPTGWQSGDLLLVHFALRGNATATPPSGWTSAVNQATGTAVGDVHVQVFTKIAAGGETNPVFTRNTSGEMTYSIAAYSGGATVGAALTQTATATVSIVAPSVNATGAGKSVHYFVGNQPSDVGTPTLPAGLTSRAVLRARTDGAGYNVASRVADRDQAAPGATGAFTSTLSGANSSTAGVTVTLLAPNVGPNAPTLTSPADGSTIDLSITQRLAWAFSDPDFGDSQSKFDLRYRVVGAPAWTNVTGTTPNQFWDAPAGTFTAGDYEWQARTYDAQGLVGPYSPSGFFTAAVSPGGPTITAPTSGAAIATSTDTLTWSTPDQDGYQARRVADNAGAPDTSTVYWDSGEVVDAVTRSLTAPFPTNNRWEHVQVRVKVDGLWGPWADVRVQVSWTAPAVASVTLTTYVSSIGITVTNPAPSGGEPSVAYNDIFLSGGGVPWRAATMVPPNSTWPFETPASGVDYTVQVVAVATNGTTSTTDWVGAPSEPVQPDYYGGAYS